MSPDSLWSFARTRIGTVAVHLAAGTSFLVHWGLRGAWTAAGATALMMLLAAASAVLDGPANSLRVRLGRTLFLATLGPVAVLTVLTWSGWPSLFAGLGTAVVCLARWQTRLERFRAGLLLASLPWLAHNILAGSLPAVAGSLFDLGRAAARYAPRNIKRATA